MSTTSTYRSHSRRAPLARSLSRRAVAGLGLVAMAAVVAVRPLPVAAESSITEAFKASQKGSAGTVDHSVWTAMLGKYVVPGPDGLNRVDYAGWKSADHRKLKDYVDRLEGSDPRGFDRPAQFAYWANLYNAKTIDIVLDHYPVESIRQITIDEGLFGFLKKSVNAGGPWKSKVVTVAGTKLSLDDIEHEIMRPIFKDPRVHYAVNCASVGCPNLGTVAFTAENLDSQLDQNARAFVNHPRGIRVDADGQVHASSIYQWFQSDFGGDEAGVLAHVRKYAGDDLVRRLEGKSGIASYSYDWAINDIKRGS